MLGDDAEGDAVLVGKPAIYRHVREFEGSHAGDTAYHGDVPDAIRGGAQPLTAAAASGNGHEPADAAAAPAASAAAAATFAAAAHATAAGAAAAAAAGSAAATASTSTAASAAGCSTPHGMS